jgi:chaperone modulatory protein CbpM
MEKHEIMIIANDSQESWLTVNEICEICHISTDVVEELIAFEIIHPKRTTQDELVFDMHDLQRVKSALRLQHDLEINLAGIAVVLDLLDELHELRERTEFLQRHF